MVDLIEHWCRAHKWSARRISHELAARGTVGCVVFLGLGEFFFP